MRNLKDLGVPLRYRDFRFLWGAQVLSELGDWSGRLALSLLVVERTHSAAIAALVTSFSILPYIGLGQVLATIANRHPRKRTILITDLGRAAVFAAMALPVPVPVLLALALLAGVCTPPFEAARNSLTPLSVPREHYGRAIALASMTFDSSVLFGYATGGGLVALFGARPALLVNSLSFLASAALLLRIPAVHRPNAPEGVRVTLRDAWAAVTNEPFVRRFLVSFTVVGAAAVVVESLVAVYAVSELGAGATTTGLLAAALPAGAILGVAIGRSTGGDAAKLRRAGELALIGAVGALVVFGVGPSLPVVAVGFLFVGALNASRVPANEVAVLRLDDSVRVPAFSIIDGFVLGSQAAAAAAGGLAARTWGLRPTFIVAMAAAACIGIWGIVAPPRERPRHSARSARQGDVVHSSPAP